MNIQKNVSLKDHSTMRLGGRARFLATAHSPEDLSKLIIWAKQHKEDIIVIGDGSNIVWKDDGFAGLVIVNGIKGFNLRQVGSADSVHVTLGSGENWDTSVERSVSLGFYGIERLSLIPGTCGAAPVQNIGAYGSEIKDTLVSVRAYDTTTSEYVTLSNQECQFSYRSSIFNSSAKGRYIIVSVTLKLTKTPPKPPFYASLQEYFDTHHINDYTPVAIRTAVLYIRKSKLPDPMHVANNGSFFGNPIVGTNHASELKKKYPDMPSWPTTETKTKLSAAWLIEEAGFKKGYHDIDTGMSLWHNQALVLVNEHASSTADLLAFKRKITRSVKQKFGVQLQQEPELI